MHSVNIEKLKPNYLYIIKNKYNDETHWNGLIILVTEHEDRYVFFDRINYFDKFVGINSIGYLSSVGISYNFHELGYKDDYPEYFI